ncbi:MerR family transcriptional regulator [Fictibacillus aquaticus]|uniref:MerR family transcriptional regulator n=1 Tax=Fictibacillus aquaticus TaxID=2021314 RepID=A0A235FB70_9BACL|nr:MerR family transcriptional regulator [Fictibacillus aquaticus]OYD58429.1 MerR family transcriptional regulator [Fictibacillus aquaticus]
MASEGKYNIKAVSKMLGIQAGTLRAWERRYAIVQPKRNEAGHRLYTDDQIYILKWLINKVNKGFTISQAVDLAQSGELYKEPAFVQSSAEDQASRLSEQILEALLTFQERKAQDLISQAFSMYTIEKVVIDILGSLLVKIGYMWEEKKITVAHEHYASSFLRVKIGQILHSFSVDPYLPRVMAFCGPGEEHELGLLIFTLYLRRNGFEVIYLGQGIPQSDLEKVIADSSPKFVFVSCTIEDHAEKTVQWLQSLEQKFADVSFGAGGTAFNMMADELKTGFEHMIVGSTRQEWEDWIEQNMRKS